MLFPFWGQLLPSISGFSIIISADMMYVYCTILYTSSVTERGHSLCCLMVLLYKYSLIHIHKVIQSIWDWIRCWPTPHPAELCPTLLTYAAPCWAMPHSAELRRNLLSYAPFCWPKPHPADLCPTLLTYSATCWPTQHLAEPKVSYAAP